MKRKPAPRKGEPRGDTRVSLAPLGFEEALRDLMATGTYTDEEVAAAAKRARDDERESDS